MQVLRWAVQRSTQTDSVTSNTAGSTKTVTTQVTITLPDASYEPAAMAVLAGLYQVEPWPKLLAGLTPQQQVQAAVLADMWQLPAASQAALALLQVAITNSDRLSAVLEQLCSIVAVPDCLLLLFEQAWLTKYGDLVSVWGPLNSTLQESLLVLPLHPMELLLASDKLKVRVVPARHCHAAFW